MTAETATTSVTTEVTVRAPVERAFRVFTEEMQSWWNPDHHLLDGTVAAMVVEPRVGGGVIDRYTDGRECRWGRVLAWEPPARFVFSWDITLQWQVETDPSRTSEVEIRFTPTADGGTHVVLEHSHLDRHGDGWESMRDAVGSGWSLTRFAEVVDAG